MRDWLYLTTILAALAACNGDEPADGDETDADADADADSDADTDADADADADAPEWTGNWRVEVDWAWTCDNFGNLSSESGSDAWTLVLSGPPSSLTATVNGNDWYTLDGSGDDRSLLLCGSFPIPDVSDVAPSGNGNNLCVVVDEIVGAEEGHGVLEGSFEDSFGRDCDMDHSPLVVSR